MWSGDTSSKFEVLAGQIRLAQSVAMSGLPWWSSDIGGYHKSELESAYFHQLVVRWFQFACFCPLFRLHGKRWGASDPADHCGQTNPPNEVWSFGEPALTIISGLLRLRETLRPYISAQLNATAVTGVPLVLPMVVAFPADALCGGAGEEGQVLDDQYMFGQDWLVAPVYVENATARSVCLPRLPAGESWTHYYSGERVVTTAGPKRLSVPTPLESFPLYRRGRAALA